MTYRVIIKEVLAQLHSSCFLVLFLVLRSSLQCPMCRMVLYMRRYLLWQKHKQSVVSGEFHDYDADLSTGSGCSV